VGVADTAVVVVSTEAAGAFMVEALAAVDFAEADASQAEALEGDMAAATAEVMVVATGTAVMVDTAAMDMAAVTLPFLTAITATIEAL
jgi:hypothetical protein